MATRPARLIYGSWPEDAQRSAGLNPFAVWVGLLDAWQVNTATGARLLQTWHDADVVVAARSDIIGAAVASPATADYGELARMIPEKTAAFVQSSAVLFRAWLGLHAVWRRQAEAATRLVTGGRSPTAAELTNFWSGATGAMLDYAQAGSRAGRDALAPVARTVAANARRLRPK